MHIRKRLSIVLALGTFAAAPSSAADLEKELRARWQGTWVVLRQEVRSNCDSRYTNVPVLSGRTTGKGRYTFAPGELGRVAKVNQQRSRVDLLIDLSEPRRFSWVEGPFELFEQRPCRVELEVDVPRDVVKRGVAGEVSPFVESVAEFYDNRAAAAASGDYNVRVVEALPEDYEQTLADYERWKLEMVEIALHALIDVSLEEAADIVEGVESSELYSDAFMDGLREYDEKLRYTACPALPDRRFSAQRSTPPTGLSRSERETWERGWNEGQELAFLLEAAVAAKRCLGG